MKALKYCVKNKVLFETWKQGKWGKIIIIKGMALRYMSNIIENNEKVGLHIHKWKFMVKVNELIDETERWSNSNLTITGSAEGSYNGSLRDIQLCQGSCHTATYHFFVPQLLDFSWNILHFVGSDHLTWSPYIINTMKGDTITCIVHATYNNWNNTRNPKPQLTMISLSTTEAISHQLAVALIKQYNHVCVGGKSPFGWHTGWSY